MGTQLVYYQDMKAIIHKQLDFDMEIRVHPRILELYDVLIETLLPEYSDYDMLVFPYRKIEHFQDVFQSDKEDTPSFFEVLEPRGDEVKLIHANYISPNLRGIEPISQRWARPLGRFETIHTVGAQQEMESSGGYYVTLLVKNFEYLKHLFEYEKGLTVCCFATTYPQSGSSFVVGSHDALMERVKSDDIYVYGERIETTKSPRIDWVPNNTRIFTVFYGVFYVPLQRDYRFGVTSGSGDEAVEIYIDDTLRFSVYDYHVGESWSDWNTLSVGFHTIKIVKLHRKGGSQRTVRIHRQSDDAQAEISVSGFESLGLKLYTPTDLKMFDDFTVFFLNPIQSINEYSLLAEDYVPVTTLVVPMFDEIRQKFAMKHKFNPDSIELINASVAQGAKENINNPYSTHTSDVSNVGVFLDKIDDDKPFDVVLKWENAIPFSYLTVHETIQGYYKPSKLLMVKIHDVSGDLLEPKDLLPLVDTEKSFNIKDIKTDGDWLIITKENTRFGVSIVFKSHWQVSRIALRAPLNNHWCLTSVEVGVTDYQNFYLCDRAGVFKEFSQLGTQLVTFFDQVSAVPEVYHHDQLPADIKYGSEFVMFAVKTSIYTINIDILGTTFDVANDSEHIDEEPKLLAVHNIYGNKYSFNVYSDFHKTTQFGWNYITYDATNDQLTEGKPSSLTYVVRNLTGNNYSNAVVVLNVPHYNHAWQASVSGNPIPCQGKRRDGTYTVNFDEWDSNQIVVQLSSLNANSTVTVELSEGNFSGGITGTELDIHNYTCTADYYDTSVIVSNHTPVPPGDVSTLFVLEDATPSPSTVGLPVSYIPYYEYFILDKKGRNEEREIILDVSAFRRMYGRHVPFKLIDARTKEEIPYCYRNGVNDYTRYFGNWFGHEVVAKVQLRPEGTKLLLISGEGGQDPSGFQIPTADALVSDAQLYIPFESIVEDRSQYQHDILEVVEAEFVPDKEGKPFEAVNFATHDSTVLVDYQIPLNNFAVSFWLFTSAKKADVWATVDENEEFGWVVSVDEERKLLIATPTDTYQTDRVVGNGLWHHILIQVDASNNMTVYVDNEEVLTTTVSFSQKPRVRFAVQVQDGYKKATFRIDEFRVYPRTLTSQEIATLYENFRLSTVDIYLELVRRRSPNILYPVSMVTSLLDLKSVPGTPVVVYKYIGIDTVVVEQV